MKNIIVHLFNVSIIGILAVTFSCKLQETENTIKLSNFVGTVTVKHANIQKTPAIGDVLNLNDTIITGDMSIADISLGQRGIIRIQEKSSIQLSSIDENTKLKMTQGEIYVTVSKLTKGSFKVEMPTAVASVRGTSFRVSTKENKSRLDVISGQVKVNPVSNNTVVESVEQTVEPNQTTTIDDGLAAKAAKAAEKQKTVEIKVTALSVDDIKEIKENIETIKPEIIEKLNPEAKSEINKMISPKKSEEGDLEKEKQEKEKLEKEKQALESQNKEQEKQKKLALKKQQEKDRLMNLEKEKQEKERLLKEKLEKERIEKERKEKEKRERASNVPTL